MCRLIYVCFCARVDGCVMTQLGGCFKSRRIEMIWGAIEVPIRSLVRGADRWSLPMRIE